MLKEMVNVYNSFKIKLVAKLGESHEGLTDELDFLDDSLVASKINYVKKVCRFLDDEIAHSNKEEMQYLMEQKQNYIFEIVFLASNNVKNIDFCLGMLDKKDDFIYCLNALSLVKKGKDIEAKALFDKYFDKYKSVPEHYLISKIYGELLIKSGDLYNGALFLRKAVEKRPDEIEIHKMLEYIYSKIGEETLLESEREIISILQ
ncbi:hypothetical protein KPL26_12560 [Clostridium algidicarnis]|uniref:tetratricopeptide repeat protein n=1 Tax=Clostridium algidicarnis TaxID=37659 RepID=UPI001C0D0CAE|nr:tetratricopeptide repeat protein [Clostridium algidicarnis]MBU3197491.1 hypothetical protein [Clostridium algidicarnis]